MHCRRDDAVLRSVAKHTSTFAPGRAKSPVATAREGLTIWMLTGLP